MSDSPILVLGRTQKKKKNVTGTVTARPHRPVDDYDKTSDDKVVCPPLPATTPDTIIVQPRATTKKFYTSILASLQYDTNPPDRPHWLTGLNKPLPLLSLTSLEDQEVLARFWLDKIKQLKHLRPKLPFPDGQPKDGEWTYNHFGETKEVRKQQESGRSEATFARGCWEYVVGGETVWRELDEWPMSLEGEFLGWGTRELKVMDEEVRYRVIQLPGGEE